MDAILAVATIAERELFLVASLLFLVFGIDDLTVDAIWIWSTTRTIVGKAASEPDFGPDPPCFAILIPTWKEAAVIGTTLSRCLAAYDGHAFRIIVGCYPNDLATISAVASLADDRVRIAVKDGDGPTTKGDCLNAIWRHALEIEQAEAKWFDAVVLHDAEDWASAEELGLFARWLDRFALLQLPVTPIRVNGSRWISGHYCDEFAESHQRSMIVRQIVGASMPSAGVGCCIRRDLMERLAASRNGDPFDAACLTEDYELGLFAKSIGAASAFIRHPAADGSGMVATRACFPATAEAAVKQKARWITGIALSGWDRTGWGRGIAENWMRLRDRKAILEALALSCAYAGVGCHVVLLFAGRDSREAIAGLETLLLANLVIMAWRLAIRAYCTANVYGWREGVIGVPRAFIGNVIAILAARRAIALYLRMHFSGRTIWEKTDHKHSIDHAAPGHG